MRTWVSCYKNLYLPSEDHSKMLTQKYTLQWIKLRQLCHNLRHFEKAAIDQDENDTKERARKIRNKIHIFWNDSLSKRKELFWKRLHNKKDAELYEFYMQKKFVPKKF